MLQVGVSHSGVKNAVRSLLYAHSVHSSKQSIYCMLLQYASDLIETAYAVASNTDQTIYQAKMNHAIVASLASMGITR